VAYGATLTVEKGVILNGENHALKIWGTLNAEGSEASKVVFNHVNITPGNSADPAELFVIDLQHSKINSGSLYSATGNAVYGSLILKDSELIGIPYIYLWYPKADCYIERNIFLNSGGISVGIADNVKVFIRNNIFYEQTGDFAVENWASYSSSETVVEGNSFLSTDKIALRLPSGYSSARMTAVSNYWGTTDISRIDSMIYDKNDDLGCADFIEYEPVLSEPHSLTPDLDAN
jgi:hypothetical protein